MLPRPREHGRIRRTRRRDRPLRQRRRHDARVLPRPRERRRHDTRVLPCPRERRPRERRRHDARMLPCPRESRRIRRTRRRNGPLRQRRRHDARVLSRAACHAEAPARARVLQRHEDAQIGRGVAPREVAAPHHRAPDGVRVDVHCVDRGHHARRAERGLAEDGGADRREPASEQGVPRDQVLQRHREVFGQRVELLIVRRRVEVVPRKIVRKRRTVPVCGQVPRGPSAQLLDARGPVRGEGAIPDRRDERRVRRRDGGAGRHEVRQREAPPPVERAHGDACRVPRAGAARRELVDERQTREGRPLDERPVAIEVPVRRDLDRLVHGADREARAERAHGDVPRRVRVARDDHVDPRLHGHEIVDRAQRPTERRLPRHVAIRGLGRIAEEPRFAWFQLEDGLADDGQDPARAALPQQGDAGDVAPRDHFHGGDFTWFAPEREARGDPRGRSRRGVGSRQHDPPREHPRGARQEEASPPPRAPPQSVPGGQLRAARRRARLPFPRRDPGRSPAGSPRRALPHEPGAHVRAAQPHALPLVRRRRHDRRLPHRGRPRLPQESMGPDCQARPGGARRTRPLRGHPRSGHLHFGRGVVRDGLHPVGSPAPRGRGAPRPRAHGRTSSAASSP